MHTWVRYCWELVGDKPGTHTELLVLLHRGVDNLGVRGAREVPLSVWGQHGQPRRDREEESHQQTDGHCDEWTSGGPWALVRKEKYSCFLFRGPLYLRFNEDLHSKFLELH